jgi:hypothetical protein
VLSAASLSRYPPFADLDLDRCRARDTFASRPPPLAVASPCSESRAGPDDFIPNLAALVLSLAPPPPVPIMASEPCGSPQGSGQSAYRRPDRTEITRFPRQFADCPEPSPESARFPATP